jgi:hypothetical protein
MSDKVGAVPPRLHSIPESYRVTRSPRGDVGQHPSARPAVRQAVWGGREHNRSWLGQRCRLSLFPGGGLWVVVRSESSRAGSGGRVDRLVSRHRCGGALMKHYPPSFDR